MPHKVALIVAILLSLSLILTSSAVAMPTHTLTILPKDCKLLAGEELLLTLDGFVPQDSSITWDVSRGGISSVLPGQNAILIAPPETTIVTISVSISSSLPGAEAPLTRQCIVTSPNSAPSGVAQVPGQFLSN